MPTTIPYDPGLVLGNIVDQTRINNLQQIADAQQPIDAAQDKLNALILQRRSLDMTMQEMINMGVDGTKLTEITDAINKLSNEMVTAAVNLSKQVISAEEQIANLKSGSSQKDGSSQKKIIEEVESPIDYNKSAIKQMPLSSDSLKFDVQYFRNESNEQGSSSHANAIATYVSYHSRSIFGYKGGAKHGAAAKDAVAKQVENHNIEGTLVITANCTHKQADVFAPFVIDVDKAIHAWNVLNDQDQIDMDDPSNVANVATDKNANQSKMSLLSGATYGSSFVGMVHIVQREDTRSSQAALSLASSLRAQMDLGGWFAKQSGELGVDSSFSNSVKNLLSTSNLSTHCSVITMGLIPSIKAATVTTVVKKLMGGPQEHMEQLAAIQGSTGSDLSTVASSASSAKEGQTLSTLSNDYMKAAVDAVGEMDKQANQVIDTNSMMTAFDDYIQKAIEGKSGVPINFFLKPINKRQIAKAWVDKYYPGEYEAGDSLSDQTDEETTA